MAEFNDDVFFATASELNAKLRAKEFSARELTRAFVDRLEKLGPRYNALSLSLREEAIRRAGQVDDEIKRGRLRGPFQGVPFGAKDLLAYPGHPTTWGAQPLAGQVINETAAAIDRLEKSGAILIGKLAMVELAGAAGYRFAAASMTGPGLNPWDRTRWSGGSSSGSGAAVAAGLVPIALGSETNGSIVTPAAFCGVTGLRPTYGLVSRHGAMALAWTLDKIGPMTRSVEDAGKLLQLLAGGDQRDPGSSGKRFFFAPQFVRPFKELKLGFATSDWSDLAADVKAPLNAAFEAFKAMGFQHREVELPDLPYGAIYSTIMNAEGAAAFAGLIESGAVDRLADARQIAGLKAASEISAKEYLLAMRARRVVQEKIRDLLVDIDLLIVPARFMVASLVADPLDRAPVAASTPARRGLRDLLTAGNLCGLPALSIPAGFAGNLPVGVMLVTRPFAENTILAAGMEYQKATDWHRRRPPVA